VLRRGTAALAVLLGLLAVLSGCGAPPRRTAGPVPLNVGGSPLDTSTPAAGDVTTPVPSTTPTPVPAPGSTTTTTPRAAPVPTTATTDPEPNPTTTTTRPPSSPQWTYAGSDGPIAGTTGAQYRYRVAVESGVPVGIGDLTAVVTSTLGDPRSWTAGGIRLRQVGGDDGADFTVWLASPATAFAMCRLGGIDIRIGGVPYTSCRVGSNVVLNADRYLFAVPGYGTPLSVYRQYMVNHEVGHFLGNGHELCPGPGRPAPVMQQQTLGLAGCVANAWPYLNGVRYSGPPA
jgi:hypothetical protein